jgi:CheY-like chemotaxis protein
MPGTLRVLVVEDDPDDRESLCALLGRWGFECRSAPDGPAGVALASSWRPHAAFVDLGLPGFDGLAVGGRLKAGLGAFVLLVALTGHADDGSTRQARFDGHLVKPADPKVLRRLLDDRAALVRWGAGDDW